MEKREFLGLHNLIAPKGARTKPKRLGRGESSGLGKTSGRGNKGQKARKSGNVRIGFQGGGSPLYRMLPKQGFKSMKPKNAIINLSDLANHFTEQAVIDPQSLIAVGLMKKKTDRIKILSNGEAIGKLSVKVHAISTSAKEKIEKAGGSVEIIS